MKIVLKIVAVAALTFLLARSVYSLDWVDAWFHGPQGRRLYYALADVFNVRGSEDADRLVLNVILGASLVLSIAAVWFASRVLPHLFRRSGLRGDQ